MHVCGNAELMLLGFISLLLTVFQSTIVKICVPQDITEHLLPCPLSGKPSDHNSTPDESADEGFCAAKVTAFICLHFTSLHLTNMLNSIFFFFHYKHFWYMSITSWNYFSDDSAFFPLFVMSAG